MEWGDFLNTQAQDLVSGAVAASRPRPSVPVSVSQQGIPYVEGKPVAGVATGKIFGMNKTLVIGGAVALLVGGYLLMRKK